MTKKEQRKLLRQFCRNVVATMLERSKQWPKEWDGGELRELAAYAFNHERVFDPLPARGGKWHAKRIKDARDEIVRRNLY